MSEKLNINSNSKLIKNTKAKKIINKPFAPLHIHQEKNEKMKQKNMILKSKTPIKDDKSKNGNNNININKSSIMRSTNSNYNINNNISININISMQNNDNNNKSHKSISGIQNKSVSKKNPISIKKDELKNAPSLIIKNTINKNNNIKQTKKIESLHDGSQSSNNVLKNKNNKQNQKHFSITASGFYPSKKEKNKNISLDNLKIQDNLNESKKDYTISTIVHKNNNNKKIINKNIRLQKKSGHKRNNFSPGVNRELLNIKQNEILNRPKDNKKSYNQKDDNKIMNENHKNISTSPLVKNKKTSVKNRAKSISNVSNELDIINNSVNIRNKIHLNENEKKQILNYKAKPKVNNIHHTNNDNKNLINRSEVNLKQGNKNKYALNSPRNDIKSTNKLNKIKINEITDQNKRRASHGLKNIIKAKKEEKKNKKLKEKEEGKKKKRRRGKTKRKRKIEYRNTKY